MSFLYTYKCFSHQENGRTIGRNCVDVLRENNRKEMEGRSNKNHEDNQKVY